VTKNIVQAKDYSQLISIAQVDRPAGVPADFVRVDLWGKEFGEGCQFARYKAQDKSKKYRKAVSERESIKTDDLVFSSGRGSKTGTWVHPLIAANYASWLSADFAALVSKTFLQVLDGDSDLAADMMIRDHNKSRQQKALKRVKATISNRTVNALSQEHGLPFYKIHDDRNVGLYGLTTKQLRVAGKVEGKETPLNYLSDLDLSYADTANGMVIAADNPSLMALAAAGIADLHRRITGKQLDPTWDEDRLTPSKARAITHSAIYQGVLPL
jgi:hypothetical protein